MKYDVIIVGAGHAGCEAALVTSKNKYKTLLLTLNKKKIASLPCNPSIGGTAKGIVVKEIDALGGVMAINADKTSLQMKILNKSRGPAVHSLRAQIDKEKYSKEMLITLESTDNLTILEKEVTGFIIENDEIKGIKLEEEEEIFSKIVILTTGTYLKSNILIGSIRKIQGPDEEKTNLNLSKELLKLGFELLRLKTGTPPRIEYKSVNFSELIVEPGENKRITFSFESNINNLEQLPCYLTYTNSKTHEIITNNLEKSSMYGGIKDIKSTGTRYCPSIEDKIVKFREKERHQIFLEPESLEYDDLYVQGLSTSMPKEIQQQMLNSIKGLENAIINKYGYAIEYDAINPIQLKPSLETKKISNLFTAGQINGTSGYEEAACQGLMAGINSVKKLQNKKPLILRRDEAYIGVLIDDLVTKGVTDPYRLLTSRAEYRLLLRSDNTEERLIEYGYNANLISDKRYSDYRKRNIEYQKIENQIQTTYITPNIENREKLNTIGETLIKDKISIYNLIKRPNITFNQLIENKIINDNIPIYYQKKLEINIKYDGYIKKSLKEADKLKKLEKIKIPESIDYNSIKNLSYESREKLQKIKPQTIGQATRISGVNPTDVSLISIYIKRIKNE